MNLVESTDGINWTNRRKVYDPGGETIWHINVTSTNGEYWCYFNHGSTGNLRLLRSNDKVNWVLSDSDPVLDYSQGWEGTHIYKSSPVADSFGNLIMLEGKIWLYYSTRNTNYNDYRYYRIGLAKSLNVTASKGRSLAYYNDTDYLNANKTILISQGAYAAPERGSSSFLDWVLVRKYSNPEPYISIGPKESN